LVLSFAVAGIEVLVGGQEVPRPGRHYENG